MYTPGHNIQGGKAKLAGSKICWFWANEWIYGSKFKPHMSTQPIYIDSNQKDVFKVPSHVEIFKKAEGVRFTLCQQ